jgi:hypothetical protein
MTIWLLILLALCVVFAVAAAGRTKSGWATAAFGVVLGVFLLTSIFSLRHRAVLQPPVMVEPAPPDAMRAPAAQSTNSRMESPGHPIAAPQIGSIPDRVLVESAPRASEPDEATAAVEVAPTQPVRTPPAPVSDPFALPEWVNTDEGWQADGNYYVVVSATGRSTDECWNQLFVHTIPMTVYQYAHREIGGGWPYPHVDRDLRDLTKLLIADQHVSPFSAGSVRMDGSYDLHKLYVRLHFKPTVRERMIAARAEVLKSSRVAYTAWLGVVACGIIGVVFGYLKLDDWTEGIHTRRLRIAAGGLLVATAFFGCVVLAYVAEVESYGGLLSF